MKLVPPVMSGHTSVPASVGSVLGRTAGRPSGLIFSAQVVFTNGRDASTCPLVRSSV